MNMLRYLALALLVLVVGCQAGASSDVKEVTITLDEFGYEISQDTFVVGKPYRFVLHNEGEMAHEWVIVPRGAETEEAGIIEIMESELQPGATFSTAYTFLRPGSYDFACYIPGPPDHYEEGMVRPIEVVSSRQ